MAVRILVAEDDPRQAELIRRYLLAEGHDVTVVHDGATAVREATRLPAKLVVLDVMLPFGDGFEVCRRLRETGDFLILMVTARAGEDDVLRGLNLGADDYMTKPFSPREMVARVRALLRRAQPAGAPPSEPITVGDLVIDPLTREVTAAGAPVRLTPGEFDLLEHMAREPGRAFTRSQLLEVLHGSDLFITARSVDVHVMNLRKKLEGEPGAPRRLLTVYGIGYKLAADLEAAA
jgi:two-component system, OmpR family, alkaline phosphatase synthesis response regulator PhoP